MHGQHHRRSSSATSHASMTKRVPHDSSEASANTTGKDDDEESLPSENIFTSPASQGLSHNEDDGSQQLRRRSPLSPMNKPKMNLPKPKETPRMWKEKSSVQENVARRKSNRSVSFSPPPPKQPLSYFTVQGRLSKHNDSSSPSHEKDDSSSSTVLDAKHHQYAGAAVQNQSLQEEQDWYNAPTHLHDVCYRAKSVQDLQQVKSFFQQSSFSCGRDLMAAARRKDGQGRTPLHVLGENTVLSEALVATPQDADDWDIPELHSYSSSGPPDMISGDKAVTKFVIDVLLPANPSGMMCRDVDGYLPFERALVEWVDQAHDLWLSQSSASDNGRKSSLLMRPVSGAASAINWAGRSLHFNRSLTSMEDNDLEEAPSNDTEEGGLSLERASHRDIYKNNPNDDRSRLFPLNVRLTPHFQFALKVLSAILDQLDENERLSRSFRRKNQSQKQDGGPRDSFDMAIDNLRDHYQESSNPMATSAAVIESLASIPDLVKTILLLKEDSERSWVFSCSVIRRLILSKHSIGPWLTAMIQSPNKKVSDGAIEYLRIVSEASKEENERWNSSSNINKAKKSHEELYKEISILEGLIPSMLSLDEKAVEEAATTPIIKGVLDKMIARPFAVSVVFFDALFLAILIVCFRASVVGFLTGEPPDSVLKWIYVANACIFYFIIRELGKAISLCMITHTARTYFLSFWNILDVMAIIFSLSSTIAMRVNFTDDELDLDDLTPLRGCLAVATGLLWLRVLSLLKTINMQLATFVLAIIQITRDILWFLLILLTMVVAFAQMFYTLLIPATCASEDGADDRQCKPSEYYLSVYAILLGDFGAFEREDFTTKFSVLLIVFFSFMVVIVLLNVLIAIISDSYEKCLIRSQSLFGRARVMLLAELVSFQNLLGNNAELQPDGHQVHIPFCNQWWYRQSWSKGWTRSSALFFSLSALVVLAWFIGETVGYFSGESYGNFAFSFCSILVNVSLFAIIVTFLSRSARNDATSNEHSTKDEEEEAESNRCVRFISNCYEQFVQKRMRRVLGSTEDTGFSSVSKTGEVDEWRGRVHYMQREMARLAQESSINATDQAKALEQHVTASESRIRGELNALETQMLDIKTEMLEQLRESERRTDEMIRHNMNELLRTLTTSRAIR